MEVFLKFKTWINGPDFLSQPQSQWPGTIPMSAIQDDDQEVRNEVIANTIIVKSDECPTSKLLNYFSKWTSLKRAVAWILKFMEILQQRIEERKKPQIAPVTDKYVMPKGKLQSYNLNPAISGLSVEYLVQAEKAIVWFLQRQFFKEDITALVKGNVKN